MAKSKSKGWIILIVVAVVSALFLHKPIKAMTAKMTGKNNTNDTND